MEKKLYGFLQSCEVVRPDDKYDIEVFGQFYKVPTTGVSPLIEMSNTTYKYDFKNKEVILLSDEGKEVIRKKVEPKVFAKNEWKWLRVAKEEARLRLGLDDIY